MPDTKPVEELPTVALIGNPFDGFTIFGSWPTRAEAQEWSKKAMEKIDQDVDNSEDIYLVYMLEPHEAL